MWVCLSVCVSLYVCLRLCICVSVCVWLFICMCVCVGGSVYLSVSVSLSVCLFVCLSVSSYTGCFNTLASLPQPNWAMVHMKTIYFQNPISIPDYHASFQSYSAIYLLPVLWFMCQGRAHFHEHFLTVFLGWLSKNGHEIVNNWITPLYHTSF